MGRPASILLINPWITDFAAFDLWSKPAGFLMLASLLRAGGCQVAFIDCLDRRDPATRDSQGLLPGDEQAFGTGKFPKIPLPTPDEVAEIPRRYFRYGIHEDSLRNQLGDAGQPDLIWVTSVMTYWYPGVQQTIAAVKQVFPDTPVWLGGTYARLCPDHARRTSGADRVVDQDVSRLPDLLSRGAGIELTNPGDWSCLDRFPSPAYDLLSHVPYGALISSYGCPQRCAYCASRAIRTRFERRPADRLVQDIVGLHARGVTDFAFHDDALLIDADQTLRPVLERLVSEGLALRFHTPNGLHVDALSPDWCQLLKASGFETLRLGLETVHDDERDKLGAKTRSDRFFQVVARLREAGFKPHQIGAYLLAGLPGQRPDEVAHSIRAVARAGALPFLCEYSPIPGSALWSRAVALSRFDLANEPLTHNNTFFACRRSDFRYGDLVQLRDLARMARRDLRSRNRSDLFRGPGR